ncbi:MAG: sensor histidine kinase, partial [Actinomycetota bacterium]|nr:sensor histidine kinase [Actinomycetota bacterium]
ASLAEKLRRSNNELIAAQAKVERLTLTKERQRLAGDIHDSVTQSLLTVGMILTDASKAYSADKQLGLRLGLAREATAKALDEIRLSIDDLFEDRYASQPLAELAGTAVDSLRQNHDIQATFVARDSDVDLEPETKKALCLILQEALSNAIKHSRAERVDVSLVVEPNLITLEIIDDGEGFLVDEVNRGYGLKMMSHRAQGLLGKCHISSELGKGTSIIATIPVSGEKN